MVDVQQVRDSSWGDSVVCLAWLGVDGFDGIEGVDGIAGEDGVDGGFNGMYGISGVNCEGEGVDFFLLLS